MNVKMKPSIYPAFLLEEQQKFGIPHPNDAFREMSEKWAADAECLPGDLMVRTMEALYKHCLKLEKRILELERGSESSTHDNGLANRGG